VNSNTKIRIATSIPSLKDKIKIDLSGSIESIMWLIKFNLPLDPKSVNGKTMQVTDTDGYVMRTDITYKPHANAISITPLDSYEEQRYYLLKISKKVQSTSGKTLKSNINILFKLYEDKLSDYKTLKQDIPVPTSRQRPDDYDELQQRRKPNDLDNYVENLPKRTKLQQDNIGISMWVIIFGLLLAIVGLLIGQLIVTAIALAICVFGLIHIYIQWSNPKFRSKIYYNRGVRQFNRMQYTTAKMFFEKSLDTNPRNKLAKNGLVSVGLYKINE